jgi:hypothetical protein
VAPDFKKHLERQIGFLRRSCESYDAGYTDESVRIATITRVLIHDTKNCTSLLKHLGAMNIMLSSTVSTSDIPPSRIAMLIGMGRLTLTTGPTATGGTWKPSISSDSIKMRLSVSEWWNQIVYILGTVRSSRKDLVLAAADKDGGAHVDAKLTADYETLMTSGERGFFHYPTTGEMGDFRPIMDAHLVYLRQIGHELLNSPDLLALAAS